MAALPSCSSMLPQKVVASCPSHRNTDMANRASLWDSGQALITSTTSPTYGDTFGCRQASGAGHALATWKPGREIREDA